MAARQRGFTGRHLFLTIAGGFAIVFAVNGLMAWFAVESEPELVVDNSYDASQHFNDWLAEGRHQQQRGWQVEVAASGGQLVVTARDAVRQPLLGFSGSATLTHPLGAEPARTLPLVDEGGGRYVAGPLPAGRFIVEIRGHVGGERIYRQTRLGG